MNKPISELYRQFTYNTVTRAEVSCARLLWPIGAYWAGALLWFHFGLFEQDEIRWQTWLYLFTCSAVFVVGFRLGVKHGLARDVNVSCGGRTGAPASHISVLKTCSLLVLAGMLGLAIDRYLSGAAIRETIASAETVRENASSSWITTASAVPAGLILAVLCLYMHHVATRCSNPAWLRGIVYCIVVLNLVIAVLAANRDAFLQLVYWLAFYWLYVADVRRRPKVVRIVAIALAATLIVGAAATYILFIAKNRSTDNYLRSQALVMQPRYRSVPFADDRTYFAVGQLSNYVTMQFHYVNTVLPVSPVVNVDLRPLAMFYLRQVDRIAGTSIEQSYYDDLGALRRQLQLPVTGWASIFGHCALLFGVVGAPVFLGCFGWLWGLCGCIYARSRQWQWIVPTFVLYHLATHFHVGLTGDGSFAVSGVVGMLAIAFSRSRG